MSQTAYLVSCEVLCGEGSDGALEGMDRASLIVGVYASSEDDAMAKIEESFDEEGYDLVEAEWICEASAMTWDDAEGEAECKDIIARMAEFPEDVIYGSLYASSGEVSAAA